MQESIKKAFPLILQNACLEITQFAEFEIIDKQTSRCVLQEGNSEEGNLWAINKSQKEVYFLAIDKCLFFDNNIDPSRCDCALFDESRICFVEIKESNQSKRRDRRNKAIEQLAKTINLFKSMGVRFPQFDALVCFSTHQTFPKRRNLDKEIEFLNECGAFLYEGNLEEF
ncbi:MAG: hypothetical protein U5M51_04685 [Emticicia sp.]|nr:hypothetical protein [Emticicia sp.]